MKILFSHPSKIKNEVELINQLMTSGKWEKFHLRKPNWSEDEVTILFEKLSADVKRKTVLHTEFKGSCHSFEEVETLNQFVILNEVKNLNYCFLSPIFDSISKEGYRAKFNFEALKTFLKKERKIKVIGLGGVNDENYDKLIEMGFDGGAFLGSVWSNADVILYGVKNLKQHINES